MDYISTFNKNSYTPTLYQDQNELVKKTIEFATKAPDELSGKIHEIGILDQSARIKIAKIVAVQSAKAISKNIQNFDIIDQKALVEIAIIAAKNDGVKTSKFFRNYKIIDELAREKIALIAAEKSNWNIANYIQNYQLLDEAKRFNIAKLTASNFGFAATAYIQNFNITYQKSLVDVVKIAANQCPRSTAMYIQKIGIQDEKDRIEIAKIVAAQAGDIVSEFIQNFEIKDKTALVEIVKIAVGQNPDKVCEFLPNYGIKGEEAFIEIAKVIAIHKGQNFSKYIHTYGIQSQKVFIAIAKLEASNRNSKIYEFIKIYGINDENALIEIAKIAAAKNPKALSASIKDFGIHNHKSLIEIAKIAAKNNGYETSLFIKNYGIKNQSVLIEIAKIAAKQSSFGISRLIQLYGIKDIDVLIAIAKICASKDGSETSEYIQNYGIKNQNALKEIAKIAVERHPEEFSEFVDNYRIEDQKFLVELAKNLARKHGWRVSEYFYKYSIEDEQARIEIAKTAVVENAYGICKFITNYHIKSEKALVDIAKLCAMQPKTCISFFIKKFNIKNKSTIESIALHSARNNGPETAKWIKNFNLDNQKLLIQIAEIIAANDGLFVSQYIHQFGIQDRKALAKIAKISAMQNGRLTSYYIYNYNLQDPLQELIIFCLAYLQSKEALDFFHNYDLPFKKRGETIDMKNLFLFITCECDLSETDKKAYIELYKYLNKIDDEELRHHQMNWLAVLHCALFYLNSEALHTLLDKSVILQLLRIHDPNLRLLLGRHILNFLETDKDWLKNYLSLFPEKGNLPNHLLIPYLFLPSFRECEFKKLAKGIRNSKFSRILRDFRVAKPFYHLLSELSMKVEKVDLLNILHLLFENRDDFLINIRAVRTTLALGYGPLLKQELLTTRADINTQFNHAFRQEIPIDKLDDFSSRFKETFGQFRDTNAFIRYLGSLKKLPDRDLELCLESYKQYVMAVLNGSYPNIRYENSYHLKKIFSKHPRLESLWRQNFHFPFTAKVDKKTHIDFMNILKTSLDEHVDQKRFVLLRKYLKETLSYRKEKILKEMYRLSGMSKTPEEKNDYEIQILVALLTKLTCPQSALIMLKQLQTLLPEEQFQRDISDLIRQIESMQKKKSYDGWIISETDDACDTLLSGTEILGSCQAVDGTPYYNKCLIAYLLDGKNKLIVIKDKTGMLQARAILRLLFDEENNTPVLFLEKLYPSSIDHALGNSLINFALTRSKKLGVPLLSKEVGKEKPYPFPVVSYGSPAPYEYVDATGGIQPGGVFTIINSHILGKA